MSYNANFDDFAPDNFVPMAPEELPSQANIFAAPAPAQQSQSVGQNEEDLYNNAIMQELGFDPRTIGRKLLSLLPFTPLSRETACAPEMAIALPVLLLLFAFSSAVQYYFGSLLYGAVLFKLLISLVAQGTKTVDFYAMLSVLVYSSVPVVIGIVINRFAKWHVICIVSAVIGGLCIVRELHIGWELNIFIIGGFGLIISSFWALFGYIE